MYAFGVSPYISFSYVCIPSLVNFTHLLGWEPVAAVTALWHGSNEQRAVAAVPGLLWQCSSSGSAGSRQLSEIHGKIKKEQDISPLLIRVSKHKLWLDARSCSEMGSAKSDGVDSAEEEAVVLLIICIASQGKHCVFFYNPL